MNGGWLAIRGFNDLRHARYQKPKASSPCNLSTQVGGKYALSDAGGLEMLANHQAAMQSGTLTVYELM